MQRETSDLVAGGLARFSDLAPGGETAWYRPNFFEIRYELRGPGGVLARLSVHGIGPERYVLAETAGEIWNVGVFPLDRPAAPIASSQGGEPVAYYKRGDPVEIQFESGAVFYARRQGTSKLAVEDADARFTMAMEQVEAFPRWRAATLFSPAALELPELPLLTIAVCCIDVFG